MGKYTVNSPHADAVELAFVLIYIYKQQMIWCVIYIYKQQMI